jgi:hypothetical protein
VNETVPQPGEPTGVPVYSPTGDCASNISLLSDAVGNFGRGVALRSLIDQEPLAQGLAWRDPSGGLPWRRACAAILAMVDSSVAWCAGLFPVSHLSACALDASDWRR